MEVIISTQLGNLLVDICAVNWIHSTMSYLHFDDVKCHSSFSTSHIYCFCGIAKRDFEIKTRERAKEGVNCSSGRMSCWILWGRDFGTEHDFPINWGRMAVFLSEASWQSLCSDSSYLHWLGVSNIYSQILSSTGFSSRKRLPRWQNRVGELVDLMIPLG